MRQEGRIAYRLILEISPVLLPEDMCTEQDICMKINENKYHLNFIKNIENNCNYIAKRPYLQYEDS